VRVTEAHWDKVKAAYKTLGNLFPELMITILANGTDSLQVRCSLDMKGLRHWQSDFLHVEVIDDFMWLRTYVMDCGEALARKVIDAHYPK
jgi:hypothetical protein